MLKTAEQTYIINEQFQTFFYDIMMLGYHRNQCTYASSNFSHNAFPYPWGEGGGGPVKPSGLSVYEAEHLHPISPTYIEHFN